MIEQNRNEFEKARILHWREHGYHGKGATVVVLDDRSMPRKFDNVEVPFPHFHENIVKHSTNVCSVFRQVAPEARIVALNWFGKKKESLRWIKEHKDEIDIINCSFVSHRLSSNVLEEVSGIPMICGAGNSNNSSWVSFPAQFPWTIAIGAWEDRMWRRAKYSSYGKGLDAVAFTDIYIRNSDGQEFPFSGTSCTAPVVSGMLAIYIGWRKENGLPKLSREEIRRFIHQNSQDVLEQGRDDKTGHGLFVLPNVEELEGELFMDRLKDIRGHWAEKEIRQVVAVGLMVGDDKGNFNPDKPLTRAEFATVLARLTNKGAK